MANRLSRRQVLGIGAASLASGVVWPRQGYGKDPGRLAQYQPAAPSPKSCKPLASFAPPLVAIPLCGSR